MNSWQIISKKGEVPTTESNLILETVREGQYIREFAKRLDRKRVPYVLLRNADGQYRPEGQVTSAVIYRLYSNASIFSGKE